MDYCPLLYAEINFAGLPGIICRSVASMDVDAPRLAALLLCRGLFFYIGLAHRQSDQSLIAITRDGDNSLSMRRGKLGSCSSMNHAAGAGDGRHFAGKRVGKGDAH